MRVLSRFTDVGQQGRRVDLQLEFRTALDWYLTRLLARKCYFGIGRNDKEMDPTPQRALTAEEPEEDCGWA